MKLVPSAALGRWSGGEAGAAEVAAGQRGAIAAWQLACLGIDRHAIRRRERQGRLHRLFRGAYLWGSTVEAPGAREAAALLTCRLQGVLGLETAAHLWGLGPRPATMTVIRRAGGARGQPGLIVRRSDTLGHEEVVPRYGLPVTSPLRTLFDLAANRYRRLERAVSAAHAAGLIDSQALRAYAEARAGLPGAPALRRLAGLESRGFTRSQNERRMRALCRDAGLPPPRTNVRMHGWEVDFLWPAEGLVVEIDAINTHGHLEQFDRDRRKQRALLAAGHPVLRFTDTMLHGDALGVVSDLAATLATLRR